MGDVYKALSDPTRREILRLLRNSDMNASEIADKFELSKPTMSGHFNILKEAELVVTERKGTTITYSLNASVFEETMGKILDFFRVGLPEENKHFDTENVETE